MRRVVTVFLSLFFILATAAIVQADQPNMDKEQEDFLLSSLVGSGYIYRPGNETKTPGLEALFFQK